MVLSLLKGKRAKRVASLATWSIGIVLAIGAIRYALLTGLHHRVYHAFLYALVAERVTEDAGTTEQALEALNEFVYLNVRSPLEPTVIDDTAADVLIRGFGSCDQADFALTRLARELGVNGRLVFLRDEDSVSSHSVAELYLADAWRIFDTFYGWVPRRPDGQPATREDLAADPSILSYTDATPDWYQDGDTVALVDSEAGPAGDLASVAGDAISRMPRWVADRIQDLYLALPPPRYVDTGGRRVDDFRTPDGALFFAARNYQLVERVEQARRNYEQLIQRFPRSQYADDAMYQLGVLEVASGEPASALKWFETLQSTHPETQWREEAQYFEAEASQVSQQCKRAYELYRMVAEGTGNGKRDALEELATGGCGLAASERLTP